MEGKAEGSESSDGFRGKDTKTDENPHVEIMDSYNDSNKIFEQIPDNASNNAMTKDGKMLDNAIELSGSFLDSNLPKGSTKPNKIRRIGRSDNFACKNCKVRDDRFLMEALAEAQSKKILNNFHILIL